MQKKLTHATFKLPNQLILDTSLSYNARRMGAVLFAHRNALGSCRKSLAQLAGLACCSIKTARKALNELAEGGYVEACKHYRYDETKGRMVYDRYTYHCDLSFLGGFTLIPRSLFLASIKASSFAVALYLCYQAGNKRRAFPSLRRVCKDLWMSTATVCRAVRELAQVTLFHVEHCLKANRAFACNSYFLCTAAGKVSHAVSLPFKGAVKESCHPLRRFFFSVLSCLTVPFPRPHCISVKVQKQVPFGLRGVFKKNKLRLRLR